MRSNRTYALLVAMVVLGVSQGRARGETIRVASYNVERFAERFEGFHAATHPVADDPAVRQLVDDMKKDNDKSNWEAAETIRQIDPDVLGIVEGPEQADLDYFNQHWLKDMFKTDIVFPTNTTRHQTLCLLLKPGFEVVQRRDQYYLEKDSAVNERGERLFARGPAFCLVLSPGGYRFWIGVTHQKSKANLAKGKSEAEQKAQRIEITRWRNREAQRTHEIMKELEKSETGDVMLVGDMNDELGADEIDTAAGGDTIEKLVGPPEDGFVLATRALAEQHAISYHGYWNPKYRSLIDHVVVSKEMSGEVQNVRIVQDGFAKVASDHYPVVVEIRPRGPGASAGPRESQATAPAK